MAEKQTPLLIKRYASRRLYNTETSDYVTLEAGTGAVHTAPGHGQDDYVVGRRYGIEVDNPVGPDGVFVPGTELFAGKHVFSANDEVLDVGYFPASADALDAAKQAWLDAIQ